MHARFVTEAAPSLLRAQIALAALAELRAGSEPAKKVLLGLVGQQLDARTWQLEAAQPAGGRRIT